MADIGNGATVTTGNRALDGQGRGTLSREAGYLEIKIML